MFEIKKDTYWLNHWHTCAKLNASFVCSFDTAEQTFLESKVNIGYANFYIENWNKHNIYICNNDNNNKHNYIKISKINHKKNKTKFMKSKNSKQNNSQFSEQTQQIHVI